MALDPGTTGRKRKRPRSLRAPVMGENAKDKARVGVQTQARETFERMQRAEVSPQQFGRAAAKLTAAEKQDLTRYAGQSSRQFQDRQFKQTVRDTGSMLDDLVGLATGVKPSEAVWSYTHPRDRLTGKGLAADPQSGPAMSIFPGSRNAGRAVDALTRPSGADEIMQSLPKAKKLRREQEKGYSVERKKRAAAAAEAMEIGGKAGYQAALAQLKGELPKLRLGDDLKDFDQAATDELFTHIQQNETFRAFDKVRTQRALEKVLEGQVPTKGEIRMLERAFGPDLATQVTESVGWWRKAKNMGLSFINIPRSLQASVDLSAPFRQGLVLGAAQPRMFAREFAPMWKAFRSEGAYDDTMVRIAEMPNFPRMQKAKLAITDLEGSAASREDYFNSQLAETLTGGKRSPVRMSGRAYTAYLNQFRADAFNHYIRMAEDAGHDIDDPRLLKSLGEFINTATGRGGFKKLEGSMNALTTVFFSPRLIASRLQFFNPTRYGHIGPIGAATHPFVQAQNRKAARNLLGGIGLTLALAEMAGADVIRDPRNADFGKIKIGDTRIDITGGHQGYVVNGYRVLKGESVSSTTGEVTDLEGGFARPSRATIISSFAENKLAPWAGYGVDAVKNENFEGNEFDPARDAAKMLVPIGVGSTVEAYGQGGPSLAALTGGLGGVGFGVLTYGDDEKKSSGNSLRSSGGKRKKSLRSGGSGRSKSLRRP